MSSSSGATTSSINPSAATAASAPPAWRLATESESRRWCPPPPLDRREPELQSKAIKQGSARVRVCTLGMLPAMLTLHGCDGCHCQRRCDHWVAMEEAQQSARRRHVWH